MAKRKALAAPQMALALAPAVEPADEMEAAVQVAEASWAPPAPAALAEPRKALVARAGAALQDAEEAAAAEAKSLADTGGSRGRETLYIVAAALLGEVRVKRGTRRGWQRLPDAAFKARAQALRAAEIMVEAGRATGAIAIMQTADTAMGDYDEPVILARYGALPEGFGEAA